MTETTRRTFLGGAVAGAMAGPAMAKNVGEQMVREGPVFAGTGGGLNTPSPMPPHIQMFHERERRMFERRQRRVGGLEPHIAEMRSLSWHAKYNLQQRRDDETRNWLDKLREALGISW